MTNAMPPSARFTTESSAVRDYREAPRITISVNDRAATREAIIRRLLLQDVDFVQRSDWAAKPPKTPASAENWVPDWDYTMIAIHMAGRSYQCGPGALQMQEIQDLHQAKHWPDIGYHYAVDCLGTVYEGRDIRMKGSHLVRYNTGVIGIVLLENMSDGDETPGVAGKLFGLMSDIGLQEGIDSTDAQQQSLRKLISSLREYFRIDVLGGHREFPYQNQHGPRLCPGRHGMKLVRELRHWSELEHPPKDTTG